MRSLLILILVLHVQCASVAPDTDPLPSWKEGPVKEAITDFVTRVVNERGQDFVKPGERIAVFDNDGTLWAEQPMYVQLAFAIDRVKAMAPEHPEWRDKEPFRSILAGDLKTALAGGEKAALHLLAATHTGMTTDEFEETVTDWIATAKHPATGRLYTQMVYQPMVEVLEYLRANGFKTCIVSGGGIEFMRPWAEAAYGIPPEQVIGSSAKTKFEMRDGKPVLVKLPEVGSIDDGPGKPVNINLHIGRRPIVAFGNSDGDLQMLQWTAGGAGPRFCLIVHHTDAEREWAYDRDSQIGKLDKALDEAESRGWTIVDIKRDWRTIYPARGAVALEGPRWKLKQLDGKPALTGEHWPAAGITFTREGQDRVIAANTGVNSLGGTYTLAGDRLTIVPGAMTEMAGPPPLMDQERAFIAALQRVTSYRISGAALELLDGETVLARFERGP